MSELTDKIKQAQMLAGEKTVVDNLKEKGFLAATPDSREEGKEPEERSDIANRRLREEYPDSTQTEFGSTWVDGYCQALRDNEKPAPVTDKGVDVKFYLRKDDPVSDAVEFAEWIANNQFTKYNNEWTSTKIHYSGCVYTTPALYTIFLTQKH